jgi:polar amino acid transport system substrate-binding protein
MAIRFSDGIKSTLFRIALTLTLSWQAQAECLLTSSWDPWEPYQYQIKDTLTGLDVELAQAILQQAGCKVTFKKRPWARALTEIEAGTIDFVTGASRNPERELYANFSEPYRDETMVLLVRKGEAGKFPLQTLNDLLLTEFRLGVVRDFYYGEEHKQLMLNETYRKKVSVVPSDAQNLKKLLTGRVDGILIDRYTGPFLARQEGGNTQIEQHPVKVSSSDIFLMFSKKSVDPAQIQKINAALATLRSNGGYQAILNRYLE